MVYTPPPRLELYITYSEKELTPVVKGITRRVIIIKSPDPDVFDEAIFFVKEDAFSKGISKSDVLKEAQKTASSYLSSSASPKPKKKISPIVYALIGGLSASAVWLLLFMIF